MDGHDELARRFEAHRGQLRAVAHRMLGSFEEAEDAVQEAWLRLSRTGGDGIDNLAGWLTTVVSRICLDLLRSRASRREDPYGQDPRVPAASDANAPEEAAVLGDSVSLALLVVLDRLAPAERIAFVLHDLFGVPFDRIAQVVDRSRPAAKKLASRARQKVRGTPAVPGADLDRHRQVVEAFLAAARGGDLDGLLEVLAPDVVRRADPAALPPGVAPELRGARAMAEGTVALRERSRFAVAALVDGDVGVVVAPHGRLVLALTVTVEGERITAYDVVADPARLGRLGLGVLDLPEVSARSRTR
ncbi:sigma-70 family RNA polymerase sigma factor [Streptomyces sp. NPDC050619]|uniref:sigma-70 family RNA polymerase sigma factor n=1 Tax=Streptomyces sp. NPDC050619 TaxID=3157214 RepID=UPI003416C938